MFKKKVPARRFRDALARSQSVQCVGPIKASAEYEAQELEWCGRPESKRRRALRAQGIPA